MSDMFSDLDYNQGLNSIEKWEEEGPVEDVIGLLSTEANDGDSTTDDIDIDDIQQLISSLEDSDIRNKERQILDSISPHCFTAKSDIWDNFYLRIPLLNG